MAYQRQIVNISIRASHSWCRYRKRNYAMSIKRLLDAVERRGDIGRRVAALILPISNRPRVTSSCAGKTRLREPGEHTSGTNLASRDNVAHNRNLYTILETPPPVIPLYRKQARTYAIRWSHAVRRPAVKEALGAAQSSIARKTCVPINCRKAARASMRWSK